MTGATRVLVGYLLAAAVLVSPRACSALDDQSDDGSARYFMTGNGQRAFADDVMYGTYKIHATEPTAQANCRWQTFVKRGGHWEQESPTKAGKWNHLSDLLHRGSVRVNKPMLVVSQNCPRWEATK